jgi:hypothetical protein
MSTWYRIHVKGTYHYFLCVSAIGYNIFCVCDTGRDQVLLCISTNVGWLQK